MRAAIRSSLLLAGLLSAAGCSHENPRVLTRLNDDAALRGALPYNPLRDRVITSWTDRPGSTMSTLYGNEVAIDYARNGGRADYPAGTMLSVITWTEQEDPRWFGGNIPQRVKSVEFLAVTTSPDQQTAYAYDEYQGAPLKQNSAADEASRRERIAFLLAQRAAVMP